MTVTVSYEQLATVWRFSNAWGNWTPFSIELVIVRLYRYLTKCQVLARLAKAWWQCAVPVHPGCLWERATERMVSLSKSSSEKSWEAGFCWAHWIITKSGSTFLIKGRWTVRDEPEKTWLHVALRFSRIGFRLMPDYWIRRGKDFRTSLNSIFRPWGETDVFSTTMQGCATRSVHPPCFHKLWSALTPSLPTICWKVWRICQNIDNMPQPNRSISEAI